MHKERIVGIDFGTSTSVVRVKNYDEKGKPIGDELFTESVKFNQGASMVPSVIRKVNETYDFGYDAEVATRNAEYFRAFKIGLQSADETEREQAKWLVQEYFKYIYNVYNHQLITGNLGDKNSVNKTIVSYPVKWGADLEQFMIQTAEKAGFENVSGMDEAEAAIRAVTVQCKDIIKKSGLLEDGKPSNVMLIDMGAGTTDIVISKYIPGKDVQNEIITTWPKKGDILFGGQEVDVLLRDFLISRFPQEYREKVEKRLSVDKMKAWKENIISPVLEAGKEAITESYEAYDLADRFDTEYEEFTLDRNSFEELYHTYIAQFVELVSGAVQDAKLSPADIDLVILTGGHSKWYFVKELLTDKNQSFDALGLEKIKAEPARILSVALPQETVALGLVYSKISGTLIFSKEENKQGNKSRSASEDSADKSKATSDEPRVAQKPKKSETKKSETKKSETKKPDKFKNNAQIDYAKSLWENREEKIITRDFYIGEKIPKNKLKEFLSHFDRESWQSHTPIFYYKSSADGRRGFLITDKAIFQYETFVDSKFQIDTRDINCMKYDKADNDILINKIIIIGKEDFELTLYAPSLLEPSIRWLVKFLNNLVKNINKSRKEDPIYKGNSPVEYAMHLCRRNRTPIEHGAIGKKIQKDAVNNYLSKFYVRDKREQKPVYFRDTTFFGRGKNGILLTKTTLFYREFLSPSCRIDIQNIRDVILTDDKNHVNVRDKQGHEYSIYFDTSKYDTWGMYRFFKELIKFMQNLNE